MTEGEVSLNREISLTGADTGFKFGLPSKRASENAAYNHKPVIRRRSLCKGLLIPLGVVF